ncbi:MAG: hypothetical protein RIT38_664 [Bacteroidota bacterium]|jgi:hypothetical protein
MSSNKIFGIDFPDNENSLETYWLKDTDTRINNIPDNILNFKIQLLASKGYFYNPYLKEFHNHFNGGVLKAIIVYNLTVEQIADLLKNYKSNVTLKSLEDVESEIFDDGPLWRVWITIDTMSGIYGALSLIISIIFYFYNNLYAAAICSFIALILSQWYVSDNYLHSKYYSDATLGRLWQSYKNVFFLLNAIAYLFLWYLIYSITAKILIPFTLITFVDYVVRKIVSNKKSKRYWGKIFFGQITNYGKTLSDGIINR